MIEPRRLGMVFWRVLFSERSPEEQVVPSTFDSLRRLVPIDGGLIV